MSTKSVNKEPLNPTLRKRYIGGMGFGSKILYDAVKPGVDPFGPDNLLIFALSPLTGTLATGSGRIDITTKSPLTNMFGSSNAGGFWGPELRYAGYDAIVVGGVSPSPVYIWIDNDRVEIRSATHLWGKDTYETVDIIRGEISDPYSDRPRVLSIGLAGESLVRFACITVDYYNSASRSGTGAVMGSKNLKAIAVRGDGEVTVAWPDRFEKAVKNETQKIAQRQIERPDAWKLKDNFLYTGDLAGKHFQSSLLPNWESRGTKATHQHMSRKRWSCHCCDICMSCPEVTVGEYAPLKLCGVHTYSYLAFGALCAIESLPVIYKCHELCDRLGMDVGDTSDAVAFAMDLYQRGILSEQTTDGLELNWGNGKAAVELINRIARRQGLGDILAEGSVRAAQRIGNGAEKYVFSIGGMSPYPIDPRLGNGIAGRAWFLGHLTTPRGGDNVKGAHMSIFCERVPRERPMECAGMSDAEFDRWIVDRLDMPDDIKRQTYGFPPRVDPLSFEGKAPLMVYLENESTTLNALGLCMMPSWSIRQCAELMSACLGLKITEDKLSEVGERILALQWAYNVREGTCPRDLDWPEKFYTERISDGSNRGAVLSREKVRQTLDEYYQLRGWDGLTGIPTREKLEALSLGDVADELETLGLVKASHSSDDIHT